MNKRKKVISFVFLTVANAIILVHAVTPYHHHDCIAVFSASTQHEDDEDSHHDDARPAGHCSDRNCNGNMEDCALTNLYIKSSKCCRTFLPHTCSYELIPLFSILFSGYSMPQIADDVGLPFRQKPYLICCLTEITSQSPRLRAPPAC